MYELIDARDHGQEIARPLIIAEQWGTRYRHVFDFRIDQLDEAKRCLYTLNNPELEAGDEA